MVPATRQGLSDIAALTQLSRYPDISIARLSSHANQPAMSAQRADLTLHPLYVASIPVPAHKQFAHVSAEASNPSALASTTSAQASSRQRSASEEKAAKPPP